MAEDKSSQNPLSEWIRLQSDFQARLADETLRYLRRLQGAVAPITPGTVLLPEDGTELNARAVSGGMFDIALEVRNDQRVHTVAAPALDLLVSSSGTTWYPDADFSPAFSLIAPDQTVQILVRVPVPTSLPAGEYVGTLSLRGLRQQIFRISVKVSKSTAAQDSRPAARSGSAAQSAKQTKSAKQAGAGRQSQRAVKAKPKAKKTEKAKRS